MRRRFSLGRGLDIRKIARSLAAPGNDIRHWVSYGTVATNTDDGPNYTDPQAVVITPAGVDVDVVLEPSGYPLTCRYGDQAGTVYKATPIHAGDQVIVIIPDGDVGMIPEIVKIIPGSSDPIPVDDAGMPVFQNDRDLTVAKGVPVDLRSIGTGVAQLLLNPDGTMLLGPAAAEQMVLGTTQRAAEAALDSTNSSASPLPGLQGIWADAADACVGPLAALKPFFLAAVLAIKTYEGKAGGFLSEVAKVK